MHSHVSAYTVFHIYGCMHTMELLHVMPIFITIHTGTKKNTTYCHRKRNLSIYVIKNATSCCIFLFFVKFYLERIFCRWHCEKKIRVFNPEFEKGYIY